MSEKTVHIYTDGGCDPNPGVGGWGAILVWNGRERELSGGEHRSTNNRMEMTAAIEALSALRRPCKVALYTDSEYLKRGITEWLPQWKRRNWKRKSGAVMNEDLWRRLDALNETHKVTWHWVRGHAGHAYNERCDALATEAIRKQKPRTRDR